MRGLLVASWLTTQIWSWNPVQDATKYRLYWGASGQGWCKESSIEVTATVACTATECQAEIPFPQWTRSFVVVTAVDAAGNESGTEHGAVVSCP